MHKEMLDFTENIHKMNTNKLKTEIYEHRNNIIFLMMFAQRRCRTWNVCRYSAGGNDVCDNLTAFWFPRFEPQKR